MKTWPAFLLLLLMGSIASAAGCLAVSAATVRVSDLARVLPPLSAADPELALSSAPLPGIRRIVGPREVQAWARRAGVELAQAPGLCIERAEVALTAARVEQAVEKALAESFGAGQALAWKLVSFRPLKAPPGELLLLRGGLSRGLGEDLHQWRGRLAYDGGKRSLPLVIQLRLSRTRTTAKAAQEVAVGTRLEETHVKYSTVDESPLTPERSPGSARLTGRVVRRLVPAGQAIGERDLEPVYAVARGGDVTAEIQMGGARLAVPAVAETNARPGQRVLLRNPVTKKTFAGKALGGGRVEVEPARTNAAAKGGDQ